MKPKPRFSFEKQQEVDKELRTIHDYLFTLSIEICNAYPKQSKECQRATKAHRAIKQLRDSFSV